MRAAPFRLEGWEPPGVRGVMLGAGLHCGVTGGKVALHTDKGGDVMPDDPIALRNQLTTWQKDAIEQIADAVVALEVAKRELNEIVWYAYRSGLGPTEISEATDQPGGVKWSRQRVSKYVNALAEQNAQAKHTKGAQK